MQPNSEVWLDGQCIFECHVMVIDEPRNRRAFDDAVIEAAIDWMGLSPDEVARARVVHKYH